MADLEWSGQAEFNLSPLRDWTVEVGGKDVVAGQTRSAGGLTWASVTGAGHMVSEALIEPSRPFADWLTPPYWFCINQLIFTWSSDYLMQSSYDKPAQTLAMMQRWLAQNKL